MIRYLMTNGCKYWGETGGNPGFFCFKLKNTLMPTARKKKLPNYLMWILPSFAMITPAVAEELVEKWGQNETIAGVPDRLTATIKQVGWVRLGVLWLVIVVLLVIFNVVKSFRN